MDFSINDRNVNISPPVLNVSVNNNSVVFADLQGQQRIELNDSMQTTSFVKWLTSVPTVN